MVADSSPDGLISYDEFASWEMVRGRAGIHRVSPDNNRTVKGLKLERANVQIWRDIECPARHVVAEALLDPDVLGYVVEAWSADAAAHEQLTDCIQLWVKMTTSGGGDDGNS